MSKRTQKQQERRNKSRQEAGHKKHENKYSAEKQEKGKNGLIIMTGGGSAVGTPFDRQMEGMSITEKAEYLQNKLDAVGVEKLQPSDKISVIVELNKVKAEARDRARNRGWGW
ncbi:MAG: hypothetical protein LBG89_02965 [Rickettsiales bacterium]|jgi:4-diphosphocytidyl-2C-methyl-D-erythritol kinase|nr:hypothetical protein [Rickettsiales bacterium]